MNIILTHRRVGNKCIHDSMISDTITMTKAQLFVQTKCADLGYCRVNFTLCTYFAVL